MRVLNDREERTETTEFGFTALLSHVLLIALGMGTVLFAPMPILLAHLKLQEPWPKVAGLGGALIALLILEVPMPAVVLSFVFGLFVADSVMKGVGFWRLLGNVILVAGALGLGALFLSASLEKTGIGAYWTLMVDNVLTQIKSGIHIEQTIEWNVVRSLLLYEGPFLYLSFAILSFWFSVGAAAHLGWLEEKHAYSGESLRKISLPTWASFAFVALFIATLVVVPRMQYFFGGMFRVAGCIMFVQGSICLSRLLKMRGVRSNLVRTLTYVFATLLGFYAVIGMGIISPWFFRRKGGTLDGLQIRKMEEAI